ncbi:MAG: anaerobic C4-dicarboxylate transporter [Bacteroidales bacterium]|nr:anaerobic C4-dicarboxylate transporter [Bacteroidales bacterium]
MLFLQFSIIIIAILVGARIGGIGLGVMGGLGLAVLVFVFGLAPTSPPIDVILMIAAVISAAAAMQAAGGLDYLVKKAEYLLRKNPKQITILSPLVAYVFTFVAGTGHVAYSILPVISEVAQEAKIRPERPLAVAVIASQQAITASPISAATVALLALLSPFGYSLFDILKVSIPATLVGVIVAAIFSLNTGKELANDPEYLRRLKKGLLSDSSNQSKKVMNVFKARLSVIIFLMATFSVVLFGSIQSLRPSFMIDGEMMMLDMPAIIEIIMLSTAGLILILTRTSGLEAASGSVFSAGMQAVIAIFGIAWMGDTFIKGNLTEIMASIQDIVTQMPWLFGLALFIMSILLFSQAATVRAVMPLGLALNLSPLLLIAFFPAVNGYFFFPNYPTVVAAINFDRTGTTHIGKYLLNHSFMKPGLIATATGILVGYLLIHLYW